MTRPDVNPAADLDEVRAAKARQRFADDLAAAVRDYDPDAPFVPISGPLPGDPEDGAEGVDESG